MMQAEINYHGSPHFVSCVCKFTGKERDQESGNDYFGARYYASSMGRFVSPDPQGNSYADFSNPQSWNMYGYVLNNPLKFTDPTGMYCYYGDTDFSSEQGQKDQNDPTQWDYHSNSNECTTNGGQWYDDAYTHGGFDDYGRPEMAVSSDTQASTTPPPSTTDALSDLLTTVPGLSTDLENWAITTVLPSKFEGRPISFSTDNPYRLFGTYYCGPGGSGPTTGPMNGACAIHDACYAAAPGGGISAGNNLYGGTPMTTAQAAQAKQCNQALYDAARTHPDVPGSKAVQWWMVNGSHLPKGTYILYPGSEAVPW
jgi:RHS repeat-associated protein